LYRTIHLQPDFQAQKPQLVEMIEKRGHICLMLPKFHCELNPIEMLWAWVKGELRKINDGSYTSLQRELKNKMENAPVAMIRRQFRNSYRFMEIYHKGEDMGISGRVAPFIAKQYRGHRRVSEKQIEDALKKWNTHCEEI
jgi:hypothetical protein